MASPPVPPPVLHAWCDGSVGPRNPGAGGWAWVVLDGQAQEVARRSGGAAYPQTNNTMELYAAISLLEHLPPGTQVVVHCDSKYVVDGYNRWSGAWVLAGWRTSSGKPVKNADLWRRLLRAGAIQYPVFQHVPGHASGKYPYNELVDQLAGTACRLHYPTVPCDSQLLYTGASLGGLPA